MKIVIKNAILFILTAVILIGTLFVVTLIPQDKIQDNMEASAMFLQGKVGAFPTTVSRLPPSKSDYYADAVLLNIAYHLDSEHPAESIAWAKFYSEDVWNYQEMVREYFPDTTSLGLPANQQYLRYWHGSICLIRPLLVILNLAEIYWLFRFLMLLLTFWLVALLIRRGMKGEAAALILSLITVSIWFATLCLEFMWMFFIMLITSIMIIRSGLYKNENRLLSLFLIIGMVSVFNDFFTTETITLVIPLLFVIRLRQRERKSESIWKLSASCGLLWGLGYVGMWVLKWLFAGAVLGRDVIPYVKNNISDQLGLQTRMPVIQVIGKSILENIRLMSPLNYGLIGGIVGLLFIFTLIVYPVYTNRLKLRNCFDSSIVALYAVLGLIPYLRMAAIPNHSLRHAFFVYRAQAATVMAICFIIMELVEPVYHKVK